MKPRITCKEEPKVYTSCCKWPETGITVEEINYGNKILRRQTYKYDILQPVADTKQCKSHVSWSNITMHHLVDHRTSRCVPMVHECQDRIGCYIWSPLVEQLAEELKRPLTSIVLENCPLRPVDRDCVWSGNREGRWFLKVVSSQLQLQKSRRWIEVHHRICSQGQFQRTSQSPREQRAMAPELKEEW